METRPDRNPWLWSGVTLLVIAAVLVIAYWLGGYQNGSIRTDTPVSATPVPEVPAAAPAVDQTPAVTGAPAGVQTN